MVQTRQSLTVYPDTLAWIVLALCASIASLVVLAGAYLPPAVDWDRTYHPAARALVRLDSPYQDGWGFYNPPWALVPLAPFVAAREAGRGAVCIVALGALALAAYRLGASPLALGLCLTSPPVLHSLLNGNLEWLCLLGVILPPRWGLWWVVIKPQVAGGAAVFWTVEAWRESRWRGVVRLTGPVMAVFALSLLVYGLWPQRAEQMPALWWNASIWRFGLGATVVSVGIGVGLLAWSLRARDVRPALAASPFLSPYVLFHAWTGAVVALAGHPRALAVVWGVLWGLVLVQV